MILREIDEQINSVSVFQNHVTLQMVRIRLRNQPAKLLWLPSCMWVSDTKPAAVMGRARDSWRSKPLALVSREIIG